MAVNIRLKTKLMERGISQFEIARKIGVSDSWMSRVVQNWIDPPMEVKVKLAEGLGCQVQEIFPEDEMVKGQVKGQVKGPGEGQCNE